MARGLICDGCGMVVKYDSPRGNESTSAEESAWITLSADNVRDYHACTRECAKTILDGEFGAACEAAFAVIAEIARVVRAEREGGEGNE